MLKIILILCLFLTSSSLFAQKISKADSLYNLQIGEYIFESPTNSSDELYVSIQSDYVIIKSEIYKISSKKYVLRENNIEHIYFRCENDVFLTISIENGVLLCIDKYHFNEKSSNKI